MQIKSNRFHNYFLIYQGRYGSTWQFSHSCPDFGIPFCWDHRCGIQASSRSSPGWSRSDRSTPSAACVKSHRWRITLHFYCYQLRVYTSFCRTHTKFALCSLWIGSLTVLSTELSRRRNISMEARIKGFASLLMTRLFNFWRNLTYHKPTLDTLQYLQKDLWEFWSSLDVPSYNVICPKKSYRSWLAKKRDRGRK